MKNKSSYEGHRQRLRERFEKTGLDGFADYEVVELVLTLAIPRADVKALAKNLIEEFGDLRSILDAPTDELRAITGIGCVTTVALQIIRSVATLYLHQKAESSDVRHDSKRLKDLWRMRIGSLPNEVFEVAYLDSGFRMLRNGVERLEEGTIDRAMVYPRQVVESALRRHAYAIAIAHNHPNAETRPTEQDINLTRAIVLAAAAVNLLVIDHFVVSTDHVFSFRDEGLL